MSRPGRHRVYPVVVAAAIAGVTAVLASAGWAGPRPDGRGQVSMTTPATRACTYAALVPGDLTGSAACSLAVTYTGAMPAYLSLTVTVQSKSRPGGVPLYDGSNASGLTVSVSDGHASYTVPTGAGVAGGSCPSGFTCWTSAFDLAGWYRNGAPDVKFVAGDAVTFTATPRFPRTAGNPYQGGTATLTLTVRAVQAPANPLPGSCGTATIGRPCPANSTFSWS